MILLRQIFCLFVADVFEWKSDLACSRECQFHFSGWKGNFCELQFSVHRCDATPPPPLPIPSKTSRSGWDASLISWCRRVVINFLNGMHIHACVSYAKQDGSSGKYLRVAADIFRENSADGSAILRSSSSRIRWLKWFIDIGLQVTFVSLALNINR